MVHQKPSKEVAIEIIIVTVEISDVMVEISDIIVGVIVEIKVAHPEFP